MKNLIVIICLVVLSSCGGGGGGGGGGSGSNGGRESTSVPQTPEPRPLEPRNSEVEVKTQLEDLWMKLCEENKKVWSDSQDEPYSQRFRGRIFGMMVEQYYPKFSLAKSKLILEVFKEAAVKLEDPDFDLLAKRIVKEKIK